MAAYRDHNHRPLEPGDGFAVLQEIHVEEDRRHVGGKDMNLGPIASGDRRGRCPAFARMDAGERSGDRRTSLGPLLCDRDPDGVRRIERLERLWIMAILGGDEAIGQDVRRPWCGDRRAR